MSNSIAEIKAILTQETVDEHLLLMLKKDERKGVQTALKSYFKRLEKKKLLLKKYEEMQTYERASYNQGYQLIAGIDEVGRGPLAGPVVSAAVILPQNVQLLGINDSKQLSATKRKELYQEIQEKALAIGISIIAPEIIDQVNIYQATKIAMQEAIDKLAIQPDYLLLDAMQLDNGLPQDKIIKGDAKSISIAAASIIAKVARDKIMEDYDKQYPGYGFFKNAGYGTKEHLEGLHLLGITPIHRKTFEPVKSLIKK
ncbi:MAG: ribonuclease HII [Streptococcaceae bacterium]|nr:ribonuclease HII [Streptococcaceae bacterium]